MAVIHINQNKYHTCSASKPNLSHIISGNVDCIAENQSATINDIENNTIIAGFFTENFISFIAHAFLFPTLGRKNITQSRFKNATNAEKYQTTFNEFQKLDKNHPITGHIMNQIPNIAHISHIFLILLLSSEISEIYACHTANQLAHNQPMNLAIIKIHKFELKANNKYQIIFNTMVISKVLFLHILSESFQKINHQKNIQREKIEKVSPT